MSVIIPSDPKVESRLRTRTKNRYRNMMESLRSFSRLFKIGRKGSPFLKPTLYVFTNCPLGGMPVLRLDEVVVFL